MNRAQRRTQSRPNSNARKSGLAFLTVAGVVGGSLGLATPVQADAVANSCPTLLAGLEEVALFGGTLTADFAGTCDFSEGFIFQESTTIIGPADNSLTLRFTGDRGSTAVPVDYVGDGFTASRALTISNLNFTRPANAGGFDYFIFVEDEPAIISNSTFSDADLSAAIYGEGNLTVSDSTFENLTSLSGGPAIYNTATALVMNSTFFNNTADGQASGGAILASGSLEVTDSTFDSNQAGDQGGAIVSYAGARISNSTFVGNSATTSAAVHLGEGGVISNSTFWNNGDADTFSIFAGGASPSYLFANILANDTPNTVKLIDPTQTTVDLGANLYTDSTFDDTTSGEGSSKLVAVADLKLSPLASANASSTETVAIGADSVAYDYYTADSPGINPTSNGDFVDSLLESEDQRGASRPLSNGYDVGAYESGEKPNPSPSETPEDDSETLADTGLEDAQTNFLGLIGLGLAAIFGGSIGLLRRRTKA